MKNRISILLVVLIVLSGFAACGEKSNVEDSVASGEIWQNTTHFHPTAEQIADMSASVDTPNVSVTENDVTLTVLQTIADRYLVYILFNVSVPEDIETNAFAISERCKLYIPYEIDYDMFGPGSGTEFVRVLESNGNSHTCLLVSYKMPFTILQSGEATLTFDYNDTWTDVVSSKKSISITWDFSYKDLSETVEYIGEYSINGMDVGYVSATITPLSIYVMIGDCNKKFNIYFDVDIVVQFKDGSQISLGTEPLDGVKNAVGGGTGSPSDNVIFNAEKVYYRIDRIIDVSEVESVIIEGVEFLF